MTTTTDVYICIKTPDVDKQVPVIKIWQRQEAIMGITVKVLVPLEAASNLGYWQELYQVERRQIMAVSFKEETFEQDCWKIAKALSKSKAWATIFFNDETKEEGRILDEVESQK